MKPKLHWIRRNGLSIVSVALPALSQPLLAAPITWANSSADFNAGASWTGGIAPGTVDIATFTGVKATDPVLSAPATVRGLAFSNAASSAYSISGSILTLGSGGIDASAVTSGTNAVSSNLTLTGSGQTWSVGTGAILTVNPATFIRGTGATVQLDKTVGTGTLSTTTLTNANGILGAWAMVHNTGTSANNSGNGFTFAMKDVSNNMVPYLTATAVTTSYPANSALVNYDWSSAGTQAQIGSSRAANTIRYTGTGVTQTTNSTQTETFNALMNAGTGTVTLGGGSFAMNLQSAAGVNELVLAAMTGGITINGPIINNGANVGALTIAGLSGQTVTLNAVSTFTGATTVGGGTLLVAGTGAINTTSGITINGANAKYLHTSTVASTRAITLNRGTLDGTGTVGAVTVNNGTGGVVTHGNGTNNPLTMSSLTFNGAGTATLSRGASVPIAVTGALATTPANGKITLNATASVWNLGATNVISVGSLGTTAASDFQVGTVTGLSPRQSATGVVLNGNNVAIQIDGDTPVWTGAQSGDWTTDTIGGSSNWKLQTAGTATDYLTGDLCLFNDNATGSTSIQITTNDVSPATVTFDNSSKNYILGSTPGWGIATGTLAKSGTGSLTIETWNLFTGGTTFTGGGLNLNHNNALGTGAVLIGAGSAKTLNNTSGSEIFLTSGAQSWNDDIAFTGTNSLDMGSGTVTFGGSGTDRTVTVSSNNLTVGEIKATAHGLIKQGAGKLVVASNGAGTAASQISGSLNVADGTLQINRTEAAVGASGDFTATGLTGSGTILNGSAVERWLVVNCATAQTFGGTLANGGTGNLGFDKQGVGSMTLTNANSFTGQTTLEGGTLVVANPTALGTSGLIRISTGTMLEFATDGGDNLWPIAFGSGVTTTIVSNRATSGAGINHTLTTQSLINGLGGGTVNITSGGNVPPGTGRITFNQFGLGAGSVQTTTLNPTTANVTVGDVGKQNNNVSQTIGLGGTSTDNLVTGVISNGPPIVAPNAISVIKTGSSTWTLSNTNTYTGDTTFGTLGAAAGVIKVTASGALGTGTLIYDGVGNASDAQLRLSGGITLNNNVTFTPRNVTTPSIVSESGNNTLGGNFTIATGGNQNRIQSDADVLTVSGGITTTATSARNVYFQGSGSGMMSGAITNNIADVAGKINVIKEGAGTWTLSGANTTDGTTTVTAGTLAVTGSLGNTALTVNTGGTLRGSGTVGTGTAVVHVAMDGHFARSIAATAGAQTKLTVNGTLTLDAGNILDLTAASAPADGAYVLASATGGITYTAGTLNLTGVSGSVSVIGNDLVLTVGVATPPYDTWSGGAAFDEDANGDGVKNGMAWLLGAANPSANAIGLLPAVSQSGGSLVMTFTCLNAANRGNSVLSVGHSSDLGISDAWAFVDVPDTNSGPVSGVTFSVTPGSPSNNVTATISSSEAAAGKLFGRLKSVK